MNQRLEKGMQRWQDIGSLLWRLPRYLLIGLVRFYQLVLSPHFPATCRYTPSCSQYAIEAFEKYGAVRGMLLTFWRLVRCHPWGGQGYDPPRWFGEPLPQPPENADP